MTKPARSLDPAPDPPHCVDCDRICGVFNDDRQVVCFDCMGVRQGITDPLVCQTCHEAWADKSDVLCESCAVEAAS